MRHDPDLFAADVTFVHIWLRRIDQKSRRHVLSRQPKTPGKVIGIYCIIAGRR